MGDEKGLQERLIRRAWEDEQFAALLRTNPNPSDQDITRLMDRNVCRCGEFPRLVAAVKLAAAKSRQP